MRQLDLPGFSDDDREIHKGALRTRLQQIPEEIEQEKAVIRRRFADPKIRLFPVAVTFLIPERLNR